MEVLLNQTLLEESLKHLGGLKGFVYLFTSVYLDTGHWVCPANTLPLRYILSPIYLSPLWMHGEVRGYCQASSLTALYLFIFFLCVCVCVCGGMHTGVRTQACVCVEAKGGGKTSCLIPLYLLPFT